MLTPQQTRDRQDAVKFKNECTQLSKKLDAANERCNLMKESFVSLLEILSTHRGLSWRDRAKCKEALIELKNNS